MYRFNHFDDTTENIGKLSAWVYRNTSNRDLFVSFMADRHPDVDLSTFELLWEAIDAYEDNNQNPITTTYGATT